jgi:hypothetical protein
VFLVEQHQVELEQNLLFAPFKAPLDLGQGIIPVRPALKVDNDAEEVLAPSSGMILDEA